jgi:hypothetical protein
MAAKVFLHPARDEKGDADDRATQFHIAPRNVGSPHTGNELTSGLLPGL